MGKLEAEVFKLRAQQQVLQDDYQKLLAERAELHGENVFLRERLVWAAQHLQELKTYQAANSRIIDNALSATQAVIDMTG